MIPAIGETSIMGVRSQRDLPLLRNHNNISSAYGMPVKVDVDMDAIRLIASRSAKQLPQYQNQHH